MFRFFVKSYTFRVISIISVVFIIVVFISSKLFDLYWGSSTTVPIISLNQIYKSPVEYDNFTRVNLLLVSNDFVGIEGNKKFKIFGNNKEFDYYDTVRIFYPDSGAEKINKIILEFENSKTLDSVIFVTSNSSVKSIYYKQIFYSTVMINLLNQYSADTSKFRIHSNQIVPEYLLSNNDTLINAAFNYFNDNISSLGLAECGTNCVIFKTIADKFNLPCRLVWLQGGNIDQTGYYNYIGYPQHVICEIYSSKSNKWYVVDPTFGFRFMNKNNNTFLNAVEISNIHTFKSVESILQDSIFLTRRSIVRKDYFKYYENVIFINHLIQNYFLKTFIKYFYSKFNYSSNCFSNDFPPIQNGFYYMGLKTFMYFFLLILEINSVLLVLTLRLFTVKKPKK